MKKLLSPNDNEYLGFEDYVQNYNLDVSTVENSILKIRYLNEYFEFEQSSFKISDFRISKSCWKLIQILDKFPGQKISHENLELIIAQYFIIPTHDNISLISTLITELICLTLIEKNTDENNKINYTFQNPIDIYKK